MTELTPEQKLAQYQAAQGDLTALRNEIETDMAGALNALCTTHNIGDFVSGLEAIQSTYISDGQRADLLSSLIGVAKLACGISAPVANPDPEV